MRRVAAGTAVVAMIGLSSILHGVTGQPAPGTDEPLDVRVTIDFRNTPARDVLRTLTTAAGLTLNIAEGTLLPVTVSLTNVRLETALTGVCENASCQWSLNGGSVVVAPLPVETAAALPPVVSVSLSDVLVGDVFRAVAAALNLELIVEGVLPDERVTIAFRDAPPANVLNFLALAARCSWQFEPGRLTVRRL